MRPLKITYEGITYEVMCYMTGLTLESPIQDIEFQGLIVDQWTITEEDILDYLKTRKHTIYVWNDGECVDLIYKP